MNRPKRILPVIIISQFCCTTLWFASNAVMTDLVNTFQLFIIGTLIFAFLSIADRYAPSKVFCISAILGASFNACLVFETNTLASLLTLRFFTGFFLAGIYPVGMKIATDYYDKGLGKALGFLVGALVIGTAFPHLLKGVVNNAFQWQSVMYTTTALAVFGGLLMLLLVPNGPFRKPGKGIELSACFTVFQNTNFRAAAFGYFGHMWELYTFWAFVPIMLKTYQKLHPQSNIDVSFWSFLIIGVGGIACVLSGYIAHNRGTKQSAFTFLLLSGICCVLSPFMFLISNNVLFLLFLLFWGMVVIADSPLFSTLVAQNAVPEIKGTALTIVNCIGFAITIISIQIISSLYSTHGSEFVYLGLVLGPIFGLLSLKRLRKI